MRNELELIKKIEDYLSGSLSATAAAEFEAAIANDPALQQAVVLQGEINSGMERIVIKHMVQRAGARYRRRIKIIRWGSAGLVILVLVLSVFYYYQKTENGQKQHKLRIEQRSGISKKRIAASSTVSPAQPTVTASLALKNKTAIQIAVTKGEDIEEQRFSINASADTVIETKGGIVFSIPANGFVDESGRKLYGKVELTIKEALTPAEIIKAGLSTRSGNDLLETGGMFFVGATQGGKSLAVNPTKPIYSEVPTNSIKAGMQCYHGKQLANGMIDWVDPKPLDHDLVPLDIRSLNFYPPNYLDSLSKWGYKFRDKKFSDSLYYSLSTLFSAKDSVPILTCGINPAKIKTIWSERFQNTIISTREFEQRLYWLHKLGNDHYFDLYLDHLDQPLSFTDAVVAGQSSGRLKEIFLNFASLQNGGVNNTSVQFKKLREYYGVQSRIYAAAIAKTEADFWNSQQQLDQIASSAKKRHLDDSTQWHNRNFEEELELNMKSACQQLGLNAATVMRRLTTATNSSEIVSPKVYSASITATGWCNIDRAVSTATMSRTSVDYAIAGKRAIINYLPVSFSIKGANAYESLYVYLLPDKLNSFIRLKETNGKYFEKLNGLLRYKLVCIGYNKNQAAFIYTQSNVSSKDYPDITLQAITNSEIDLTLNKFGSVSQAADILSENDYFQLQTKDQKRQANNSNSKQLRGRLIQVFYPCYVPPIQKLTPLIKKQPEKTEDQ